MKIHESGENYLEVMLILSKEKGYIRSVSLRSEGGSLSQRSRGRDPAYKVASASETDH